MAGYTQKTVDTGEFIRGLYNKDELLNTEPMFKLFLMVNKAPVKDNATDNDNWERVKIIPFPTNDENGDSEEVD